MAVMPTPRETWTDERLDDLNKKVDNGFRETREEMRQFRTEVNARFDSLDSRLDGRFGTIDSRFEAVDTRIDARFDAMQRLIIQVSAGLFGTMLIGFLSMLAAVLVTQS